MIWDLEIKIINISLIRNSHSFPVKSDKPLALITQVDFFSVLPLMWT